jgi:hypothetical protein
MTHYVTATTLNFRSAPDETSASRKGALFLCHPVEILAEPTPGSKFCKARTMFDGQLQDGFVARAFLRGAASPSREALIAQAVKEWTRFEHGLGKETVDPFCGFIGQMWKAIGLDLDGRDTDQFWSAAAISYMVRHAGPDYATFKFAAAHARYVHNAIRRRMQNDQSAPFWGFRLHERRPQLGDIVCKWRESPVDFDDAANRDDFRGHCDIVVQIDTTANTLLAIGGNVSNSVSVSTYQLGADDFLAPKDNVFALMANRTDA